jgi:hypothetical protein
MEMKMVHRVAISAEIDLLRMEKLVHDLGDAVHILHELDAVFFAKASDVIDVLLAGDDDASFMALLLEQDDLGHRELADFDAESGEKLAFVAIRTIHDFFHGVSSFLIS